VQGAFDSVGQFFTDLLKKITDFFQFLLDIFLQVFIDLWEIFTDLFVWVFDQVISLAVSLLTVIPVPTFPDYFAALDSGISNVLGLVGAGPALAMIGSALLIRLTLQLIPFVRLGS